MLAEGSDVDDEEIQEDIAILEDLPVPMPRGSIFRIDLTTAFSWDYRTPNEHLEFKIVSPDALTNSYPPLSFPLSDRIQLIVENKNMYEKC